MSSSPTDQQPASTGELWVVATPIGNLGDMSPRAIDVLRTADVILCEDTRHSRPLLNHFGIEARVESLHEHNEAEMVPRVMQWLADGRRVALISDAGTPLVSDPGARLVRAAASAGVRVTPVPGASALLAALVASGLGGGAFSFLGFLERKGRERRQQLAWLSALPHPGVVYEAPQRLAVTLADLVVAGCGEREAVVARELTKRYEEFRRGTVADLAEYYRHNPVRGEVVLLVSGAPAIVQVVDAEGATRQAKEWRAAGSSQKEVARRLVAEFGMTRNEAYRLSLEVQ